METLKHRRPVFHSEADFQFALAWVMAEDAVERIRLERRVKLAGRRAMQLDITGYVDGEPVLVELKYPKERFVGTVLADGHPEEFDLASSGAPGDSAITFWKDVSRIETLIDSGS
jgi:hypothetical protein